MVDCAYCYGRGGHIVWTEPDDEGQREPETDRLCEACSGTGEACLICQHEVTECPFCAKNRAKELTEEHYMAAEMERAEATFRGERSRKTKSPAKG